MMAQKAIWIFRNTGRPLLPRKALTTAAAFVLLAVGGDLSVGFANDGKIHFELNSLKQQESACRITFVLKNAQPQALSELSYEVVLFDRSGSVNRLTKFDFGSLPAQKTRVKRFDLRGATCKDIGRILVNRSSKCVVEGSQGPAKCEETLQTTNKTDVEFGL